MKIRFRAAIDRRTAAVEVKTFSMAVKLSQVRQLPAALAALQHFTGCRLALDDESGLIAQGSRKRGHDALRDAASGHDCPIKDDVKPRISPELQAVLELPVPVQRTRGGREALLAVAIRTESNAAPSAARLPARR
ncbi:hypothetical protein [Hoeflea halophila]|uniref:hypothetical protein n=1 Tax=Hoeflea halophila TaxID=714899 RepID=UPI00117B40BB|nr:hypothetical protein [Hoeflea halophila]